MCEDPVCDWECNRPADCPRPKCSLICEKKSVCGHTFEGKDVADEKEASEKSGNVGVILVGASEVEGPKSGNPSYELCHEYCEKTYGGDAGDEKKKCIDELCAGYVE